MSESVSKVDNGVNVGALLDARKALTAAPEAAQFKWRASCKWVGGTYSQSKVESFFGLGAEQQHRTTFSFDADHPEVFASEDRGATPVEITLVGLASCLTAGVAAVAQHRQIQLRSVQATLEAGMDIQGILGVGYPLHSGTYKMLWSANGTPRNFCRRGQLFGAWKAVKVNDAESHRGPSRSAGESRRGRPSVAKRLLSTPVSPSPRFPTTRYWGHLSQVDTRFLGIDSDVRNGFDGIKVTYEIDADASKDDIDALVAQSAKRSAVYDIFTNPTNVTIEVV